MLTVGLYSQQFTHSDSSKYLEVLPAAEKMLARVLRSLGWALALGFISVPKNCGGSPYLSMLSVNSRTAHVWIQALKACTASTE